MKKIYFKNLNGLRFFAASMVLVSHIEQIKELRGLRSGFTASFFSQLGTLGVVLFFVLSGFLITYLLIVEKETSPGRQISIRDFYMRRILKIWPLYFIVIFIGLMMMPALGFFEFNPEELHRNYNLKVIIPLFVLFLPNVILVCFGGIPFLHQTWSIGTEEQFYLIWPLIISKSVNIVRSLMLIMIGYLIIKLTLYVLKGNHSIHVVYSIWSTLSVVSLAVGGFCAYLYRNHKPAVIKFISSAFNQVCILVLFSVFLYFSGRIPSVIRFDVFSVFFGCLILSLIVNNTFNFLELKLFNYLGKISYGIYMWHPIAITLVFKLLRSYCENNVMLYLASFILTLAIASFSYEFFEKWFLKLKVRYSASLQV
jgi:peptidoglycan/LPS O-acetylase OafA/YrhL